MPTEYSSHERTLPTGQKTLVDGHTRPDKGKKKKEKKQREPSRDAFERMAKQAEVMSQKPETPSQIADEIERLTEAMSARQKAAYADADDQPHDFYDRSSDTYLTRDQYEAEEANTRDRKEIKRLSVCSACDGQATQFREGRGGGEVWRCRECGGDGKTAGSRLLAERQRKASLSDDERAAERAANKTAATDKAFGRVEAISSLAADAENEAQTRIDGDEGELYDWMIADIETNIAELDKLKNSATTKTALKTAVGKEAGKQAAQAHTEACDRLNNLAEQMRTLIDERAAAKSAARANSLETASSVVIPDGVEISGKHRKAIQHVQYLETQLAEAGDNATYQQQRKLEAERKALHQRNKNAGLV